MIRKTALVALLAAASLFGGVRIAAAGDRDGDDGWRPASHDCSCDCGCERNEDVRLPASFFYDYGGVGPAFMDYGSTGGTIVVVDRANLSARSSASAGAHASAFANVQVRVNRGMMHMHMPSKHGW
jgi:hypothetical protein